MKIAFFIIIIGLLSATGAVIYLQLVESNFFAKQKFEELSRNYYENKLYDNFVSENSGQSLEQAFSKHRSGFNIKLRQILNYEFLEHNQNYRSYFDSNKFSCDTNESYAKFIAKAPYGKKDYDVEFNLKCSEK